MKSTALVLCLAAGAAVYAQTAPKPAAPAAMPATPPKSAPASSAVKYPPGKTASPAAKKSLFALQVQDVKVGTGAEAENMKMYTLKYTVWRAADGVVFDAWDKHGKPVLDKDGKPVMGEDGKPKTETPEPAKMPVGVGRMMPGLALGFAGMHVGGIRRIFVPWQLGFGDRALPDRTDGPGIPAKSDLVVEVELLAIGELPQQPKPSTPPSGTPPGGGATSAPATPPPASQPSAPPQPSTPPQQ